MAGLFVRTAAFGVVAALAAAAPSAASSRPNLTPTRTAVAEQVAQGATFTTSLALRNRGGRTAPRSIAGFYLSDDGRRDRGDIMLGTASVARLGAGRRLTLRKHLRIPAHLAVGRYRLLGCTDVARRVRESSERDNCSASAVVRVLVPVQAAPAPTAPVPETPSDQPTDGGSADQGTPPPVTPEPGPQVPVTLDVPADGSITGDSTPRFAGHAASGSFVNVTVQSSGSTVETRQAMPAADGSWSVDSGGLGSGPYSARASQTDAFGRSAASGSNAFTVDVSPPSATLTVTPSTPNGQNGFYTTAPTVHATAEDANLSSLACSVNGTAVMLTSTSSTATQRAGDVPLGGDGTRNVSCTATDAVGNTTTRTTTVKLDTVSPSASTSISPAAPDGSNSFYTSAVTVHATADDANLSSLTCTLDGNLAALTNQSTTATHREGDVVVSTDNSHTVACTATDAAGRTTSPAARTFKIDATAPGATLTVTPSTPSGQNGFYTTAPTVHAAAHDDTNLSSLACTVNGSPVTLTNPSTSTTDRGGDVPLGGDGTRNVSCTATDAAGNATSASTTVKVDSVSPTASTTISPSAPNGSNSFYTSAVTVHATADDANLSSLSCTLDGNPAALTNQSTTATHREGDVAVSGDGSHTVACTATDASGRSFSPVARTFKIDGTSPTAALTVNPSSPDGQNGIYTSAPTVHATADDTNLGSLACTVNGTTTLSMTSSAGTHLEGDVPLGGDGTRNVRCTATDAAGNTAVRTTSVTVDTLDPTVSVTPTPSSPNGQNGWYTTAPTVRASASDANLASLQCQVDGAAVTLTNTSSDANNRAGDVPLGGDGPHNVSCTATDAAGRTRTGTLAVKVDSVNPAASVTLTPSSPDGQNGWYTTGPAILAAADDANIASLACTRDGSAVTLTSTQTTATHRDGAVAAGGDGSHTVSCTATDSAGRTATSSATYKIDSAAPSVGLSTPAAGASTPLMDFSGAAGNLTGDSSTVTLKVYAGSSATGTPIRTQSVSRSSGSWSLTLAPLLEDGATYTAQAEQTDSAGHTGTSTANTFTIPHTLLAAGDIANCGSTGDEATAALVAKRSGTVATLGDNVYADGRSAEGSLTNFDNCYEPSWGAFKSRTRPSLGNHEYKVDSTAAGYWDYFGTGPAGARGQGWYSYDVGTWHIIVLNTNDECTDVSCGAGSAQDTWLQNDLATHPNQCTLAYFHHPRFSSYLGTDGAVRRIWDDLYAAGVEVVLNGHVHEYERFQPMRPDGTADSANGIREFVVGTGGAEHHSYNSTPRSGSQVLNDDTFGIIQLALDNGSYSWKFVGVPGGAFAGDSGTANCH